MEPMRAGKVSALVDLSYPLLASPKLDGIRALVMGGQVVSRRMKAIPNDFIREKLSRHCLNGLDGELVVGDPFGEGVMNRTQSGVMSHYGMPQYTYWVFDHFLQPTNPYIQRLREARVLAPKSPFIRILESVVILDHRQLEKYEEECVERGFEGVMTRTPDGPYKYGRSTWEEEYLLKLKRFEDAEAKIVGYEELMHNSNEDVKDVFGRAKRSKKKGGMVPSGRLGALVVVGINGTFRGVTFNLGSGFTKEQSISLWSQRDLLPGQLVRYKYMGYGSMDAPRHPTFGGFRDPIDL